MNPRYKILKAAAAIAGLFFGNILPPSNALGEYLRVPFGARAGGFGEALVAVADQPNIIFWNPAGLAHVWGQGLNVTHLEWVEGVNINYLTLSKRFSDGGAIGVNLSHMRISSIPEEVFITRGEYAGIGGTVGTKATSISLAMAQKLGLWRAGEFWRRLSVGMNLKTLSKKTVDSKSFQFFVDAGLMFELINRHFYFGFAGQNISPAVLGETMPMVLRTGLSYKADRVFHPTGKMILAIELDSSKDLGMRYGFGGEHISWFGVLGLALRAGFRPRIDLEESSGLTFGMGFYHKLGTSMASFDYSYVSLGESGVMHRISFNILSDGGPEPPIPSLKGKKEIFLEDLEDLVLKTAVLSEEPIRSWDLLIQDEEGKQVRKFHGKGRPPRKIPWNAEDGQGQIVSPGSYSAVLHVDDTADLEGTSMEWPVYVIGPPTATPTATATGTPLPPPPIIPPRAIPEPVSYTPTPVKEIKEFKYPYAFEFTSDILFDLGGTELTKDAEMALDESLDVIDTHFPNSLFLIEGHTDNVPLRRNSKYKSNDHLSLLRAKAVGKYVVTSGVAQSKIRSMGFGAKRPMYSNSSAEGRSRNRRVEMIVYGQKEEHQEQFLEDMKILISEKSLVTATMELLRAAHVYPEDWKIYRLLGISFSELGHKGRAKEAFERALHLNPNNNEVKQLLQEL